MDVSRLPGARILAPVLWTILLAGLGVGLFMCVRKGPTVTRHVDEKATLSVLRSEELAFLVTRRSATQIVIQHQESDLWGEWQGVLWATISWRWGVDMAKITEKDLRKEGECLVVHLPEPELLDFSLEPGSVGFLSKATAVPKLVDFARGGSHRGLLEGRLKEHALAFAAERKLLPSRQEILDQLNRSSGLLEQATGTRLRFE